MASAVNCRWVPTATLTVAGETEIDTTVAAVTVRVLEPERPLHDAETCAEPCVRAVRRPRGLTPATLGADESHVAWLVTLCDVLSLKIAVAWNWTTAPGASVGSM